MDNRQGGGDIPSYKSVTAGESSGINHQNSPKENKEPVMGNLWQMRLGGKCLPRAQKKPRYIIPSNKLERYNSYMKDHALICKFIGYWPAEKELYRWIYQRWKPKGHVELKLGAKGFLTAIFANLSDKERVFKEGPYFMNNAGLFMKYWEERYNPKNEKMLAAPIWVRLFGLPVEFWDPEILEGIGNTIGNYVKTAEATKRGKYTTYARLCVYMNIAEPLPEYIELEYHDEVWQQPIDYEHIPFRCRRCHEYGHLYRQCPLNKEDNQDGGQGNRKSEEKREEEFQEVVRKKRQGKEPTEKYAQEKTQNKKSYNKFQILLQQNEETEDGPEEGEDLTNSPMEITRELKGKEIEMTEGEEEEKRENPAEIRNQTQMEIETQKDTEVEEEKIMRKLIQEWKNLDNRFIPDKQKQLYKEAFQKYKEKKGKGLEKQETIGEDQDGSQAGAGGPGKFSKKRGRKSLHEAIQIVGETLINSGKVVPLSEVFSPPPRV